ncbi:MAG TPA: 16S rRNA (cytidine(1402)-2'-O)-methyltransferase [Myxococcota bacterium]
MGVLYVVATPIGNLEDITLRALRVLAEADLLLAEDTRRTRVLLQRHGVKARPLSLHAHNEAARVASVLEVLAAGGSAAVVSDAGTPTLSDPGARLTQAAIAAGHAVTPIPGPSALLAALVAAGLPAERFTFLGFLPRRKGAREALLASLRSRPETLVFFESPRRLPATLRQLAEVLGERPACVARELTKLHEELVRDTLGALAERFADGARGEVTLVVAGASEADAEPAVSADDLDADIRARLANGETARDIAAALARERNLPRRDVYARVLAARGAR